MKTYANKADAKRAAKKSGLTDFELVEVEGRWTYQTPPEKKGSPARGKNMGIGRRMAELIRAEKTTDEILAAIHSEFPDSRAGRSDVSIVRGKVRRGVL